MHHRLDREAESSDFISHLIKHNKENEARKELAQRVSLRELEANLKLLMTARSETTTTLLSGTLNYLTANPAKLAMLTKEMCDRFYEDITFNSLKNLSYEGSWLCPLVTYMLPCLVPESGDTVRGMRAPGGVSRLHSFNLPSPNNIYI